MSFLQELPVSSIFALVGAIVVVQLISFAIERFHAHKVFKRMKVVGPKPHFIHGHLYKARREQTINYYDRLHKEYGKTFGVFMGSEPWLLTTDINLIQEVFVKNSRIFQNRMPLHLNVDPFPDNVLALRGHRWRYVRSLLSPAFTRSKIRTNQFYYDTKQTVEKFIRQLEKSSELVPSKKQEGSGDKFQRQTLVSDLYDRSAACTTDIIVKTAFNLDDMVSFDGALRDQPKRESSWIDFKSYIKSLLGFGSLQRDDFLNALKRTVLLLMNPLIVLIYCVPKLEKPLTFLCNHIYHGPLFALFFAQLDVVKQRTCSSNNQKEIDEPKIGEQQHKQRRIIDYLVEKWREGKISSNELKGNSLIMVIAGFETTANTLTLTLWLLAKHENVQAKLHRELRDKLNQLSKADGKFNDVKELSELELAQLAFDCEYLEMVINECLRLYPPAPILSSREASVDCTLENGFHIERKVIVAPTVFSIHRDESLWGPDAHLFRPERFETLEASKLNSPMFMPFGFGQRICIGKMLAIHELKIVLSRLILEHSLETWLGKTPDSIKLTTPLMATITIDGKIGLKFIKR